jgi:large subunit ribosomal protein L30e
MIMETDLSKVLRGVLSTGKVLIGTRQTLDAVQNGKAHAVVVSSNCPGETMDRIKGVPVIKFPGLGIDLGVAAG